MKNLTPDDEETQISAAIPASLKARLDRVVRARGLKQGFVIERAIENHLRALEEIPEEFMIPSVITLSNRSFDKLLRTLERPPVPDDGLH